MGLFWRSYLRYFSYCIGGDIGGFISGYIAFVMSLSVLLHTVMFRIELRRDNPQIPYIQDDL
ncbi:hypothetical protein SAMN04487770_12842 [Butyrivibrio sp. ob235]|nr:hypothetical protein SAMN04487770_12842 [Butyrivibrio sp. ob235]